MRGKWTVTETIFTEWMQYSMFVLTLSFSVSWICDSANDSFLIASTKEHLVRSIYFLLWPQKHPFRCWFDLFSFSIYPHLCLSLSLSLSLSHQWKQHSSYHIVMSIDELFLFICYSIICCCLVFIYYNNILYASCVSSLLRSFFLTSIKKFRIQNFVAF